MSTEIIQSLTVTQAHAAIMIGVSDRTIRRWEKLSKLHGRRVGGVKLYPIEKLRELAIGEAK